jgi:hypothetical protein
VTISKKVWYKIVEADKDRKNVKSLFHGTNGTRLLTKERWMKAEKKLVSDGSGKTKYISGFQIVPSFDECIEYLRLFKNIESKAIVTCLAKKVRPKEHSRHSVFLADEIKIKEKPIIYVSKNH